MREILVFPEYMISTDTKKRRESSSKNLRRALEAGSTKPERRIYLLNCHCFQITSIILLARLPEYLNR